MATSPSSNQASGPKYGDLKRRIIFLLLALVVYRIGAHVPVPGIDPDMLSRLFQEQQGGILGLFNMFSGGALSRFSVFALGIMPYISASIIMQMLSYVLPSLESLRKEGESGRRKITQYTRYGTLLLGVFQAFGIAVALESQAGLVLDPGFMFRFTCIVSLVTGTMFLMWLGEQITERGLGNGISIIIFAGIVAGLPSAISGLFQLVSTGAISPLSSIFVIAIVALVTAFVVFIERGQRRITVNYAKRQVGNRLYGGQTSYLPLKMNMSGVIPPIFASSLILFPATLAGWFTSGDSTRWIRDLAAALSPGQPLYTLLYAAMIVFFAYFYTALVFNPRETAENLKKSGAFVPGIRPGEQTSRYIDKVLLRLTLGGAIYLVFVCLVPEFLNMRFNVPFYFGGTSLLIVVVVTMDFMSQVQAYMMSQQYENLLKKTNFKGFGSAGM
ncbi:preprotein translocase subunit SecY [Parasutterella secunda]|uniref:preprotein translocase subunit SecY n=1 Tax=Parasutterella secunda TaxID=626947 RepID=UPI00033F325D|nr:preprotein translocase subunit SecY [Parasutterella secunda]CDE77377.1 protein translocase subunit SecY [Sutterella sp. CAG:521]HJI93340.1 preprotein translocase subunit SecY [Sutterellaceae bacterium]MCL1596209.1 preprotein translocase subunit SecY [Parasutterella secunda]MCR8920148.1 preprotein translocase subunit SecY [Parasutterella secunda]MDM8087541.1 preprotein translocase subunit SecY [Parasutterella secunda]